jgi:hypothetical protein
VDPISQTWYIVQSPQGCTAIKSLPLVLSVICRIYILRSHVKILFFFVPPIVFSFIWGPYADEHGMVLILKYSIEDSMFAAICISSFGMDQNPPFYVCKYWVALNPGLGGVGIYRNMHFHCWPWTGSIKPSLQYFHICPFRWLSILEVKMKGK